MHGTGRFSPGAPRTHTGVAITPPLAEELWQHRRRSNFQGDDERVFCHPELGSEYHIATKYRPALERAFERAGLPWPEGLRPCHDLRVTAITTDARNGTDPIAIMTNAGHASYSTTKRYVKAGRSHLPRRRSGSCSAATFYRTFYRPEHT